MTTELQSGLPLATRTRPVGAIDTLWSAFVSPRTAGALLIACGGIDLLLPGRSGALEGALRGASALAALSLLGMGLHLVGSRARLEPRFREALDAAGLLRSVHLPFFTRELSASASSRLLSLAPTAPALRLALWLVAVALALPAVTASAGRFWTEVGSVRLDTEHDAEFVRLERPAAGAERNLGARVRLDAPALVRGEPTLPGLRIRTSGGEGSSVVPLEAGQLARAVGYAWAPRALVPGDAIGAVELFATPRGGGETARITLRLGPGVTLSDGTTIRLVEGHPSYAGQLGPAVRIEEIGPDQQVVRDEWIYGRAADFDATHGSGRWVLSLAGFALNHSVDARAIRGWGASSGLPVGIAVAGSLLVLAAIGLLLVRVQRIGRDGDWQIVEWGTRLDDSGPGLLRREMLTPEQENEVRALERELARGGA